MCFVIIRLKKSAEHRKKVLEKKQVLEQKKAAVDYNDIVSDSSLGKVTSHHRLSTYISKYGRSPFSKAYTKVQLQTLCKAYGVQCHCRSNKTKLTEELHLAINAADYMVCSYYLDNLQMQPIIDTTNRRVGLRIVRRM